MANSNTHKNSTYLKDLVLLFAVPIAIAIFAAIIVYAPRFLANPKYDFIYSLCDDYLCKNSFSVDETSYITQDDTNPSGANYYNHSASLRYYDSSNDSTRSLTIEEARQYRLNTSSKSPDGYTLKRESSNNGFLFWSDNTEGWYLQDGAKKKKVELTGDNSYYSDDIKFLGWVSK